MKNIALLCLCILSGASAGSAEVHPIVNVIGMLKKLKAQSITQRQGEEANYAKFAYWCKDSRSTLQDAIAEEKETINELEDTIAGKTKEESTLTDKISDLQDEIKDLQASAKSAKDDRAGEAKLYSKVDSDLKKTIKAMDDCIKALQGAETTTEKMMLAQQQVGGVIALIGMKATDEQLQSLVDFADPKKRPTQLAAGDEKAHVDKYDFKSENVIELLKTLKLKFEDDRTASTVAETNSLNAYALSKAARDNSIKAASKSKGKKEVELKATQATLTQAKKDLKDTNTDLDTDSATLKTTNESCNTKDSEWEERSKTRQLEMEALDAAMEILSEASGVRTKAPGNPIPPASPVKLLQVLQTRGSVDDPKLKAVALLKEAAKDAHSRALESLAMEVSAHLNGPFDAVNNMIEKMIFRLMDEQKQEDEHKLWCDEELEKTNAMKDDKESKIKELKAEIKVENGKVSSLTEDIKKLNAKVSSIVSFVKEATEIRNTGKSENKLAIKDAQDAQRAVSNAISVLESFYKESGAVKKEPWEFIQAPVKLPEDPKTWGSPFTGAADPKKQPGGIIVVLENVAADFSQMEADTKSQEQVDQKEYEEAMKANAIEKARATQEAEMKAAEESRRVEKTVALTATKKDTDGELEKTDQYLVDLKPACVDGDSKYSDRKAARAKEIKALKTAQVTLLEAFEEKPQKKFLQVHAVL